MYAIRSYYVAADVPDGVAGDEVAGLKIRVEKAHGEKCERCWNYATTVGSFTDHPTLCDRCHDALD